MSDMVDYSQCFEEMYDEEPDSPAMVEHIDAVTKLVTEYKQLKEENKQLKVENKQLKVENKQLKLEIVKLKQELLEKFKHNSKMWLKDVYHRQNTYRQKTT